MEGLFFEGLFLQASLIFALGAQNIFVLESGLKKQHPMTISFVCFFCDLILIMLGVAGAGSLFSSFSQLKIIIGVIGVFFLFQYGISKIFLPQTTLTEDSHSLIKQGLKRSILLAITFSIFNPHAYLDAFILIGGYSTKYSMLSDRLVLGFGAACFSLIWFIFLSNASSLMKPVFSNAKSLRVITTCSGLILLFLSFRLGLDVYGWITDGPHSPILVKAVNYPFPSGLMYSSILY
ncbi:MAG: LysE family transporter [Bdellovibrionales bacterium]|nr:LysE family transporter [Bdellovibrionales bacterium]